MPEICRENRFLGIFLRFHHQFFLTFCSKMCIRNSQNMAESYHLFPAGNMPEIAAFAVLTFFLYFLFYFYLTLIIRQVRSVRCLFQFFFLGHVNWLTYFSVYSFISRIEVGDFFIHYFCGLSSMKSEFHDVSERLILNGIWILSNSMFKNHYRDVFEESQMNSLLVGGRIFGFNHKIFIMGKD